MDMLQHKYPVRRKALIATINFNSE